MANQSHAANMTQGSIWKLMVRFAIPVFLGNLFQQFYNVADTFIVGNVLGTEAMAAVGSSGNLIFMLIGFFQGVFVGAGVVVSRFWGARDHENVSIAVHTSVAFAIVAGLVLTLIGVLLTPTILDWMHTPADVLPNSIEYFRVYFGGVIFAVLYNAVNGIFQAVGDSRHPLYFLIISAMLNVALDLLFVGVLGMGVGGAAFATVISQAVSAFLGLRKLMKATESYRLIPRKIRFNGRMLQKVLYIGIPSGMQNAVIALANVVVQTNINDFGALAQAGCGAYSKIEGFGFLPITSFTLALTTFIGQNLGAQEYERAKKGARFGLIACVSIAEAIGLAIYAFIPALIAMFVQSGDAAQVQEVIRLGTMHARIMTPFYFLLALSNAMASVMRGAGRSIVPMIVMLCCWCVFRVTYITVAVPIRPELTTISWAYPITWGLSSIIFLIYYNVVDWVHAYGRSKPRKKV